MTAQKRAHKKTDLKLEELQKRREDGARAGGQTRIEQQHAKGKLTARERIELLVDPGSFEELDAFVAHRSSEFGTAEKRFPGDAVVTGYARINGRTTYLYAHDFTVFGGSLSEVVAEKICKVMDMAMKNGSPIVCLADSGGARIQEGVRSLAGYGDIFLRNTLASGVVPQISAILGPSAGGAVYSPAITDFTLMVKGISQMFVTGPDVVRSVLGEEITHEQLGGAGSHSLLSGVAHFALDSEEECMETIRHLLSFLPQNNLDDPSIGELGDDPDRIDESLREIIPEDSSKAYDMKEIIYRIVDNGEVLEIHREFAPNIIVGLARLMGRSVGIVAQQPAHMAGVIDINASIKAARFVRFCDAFNIPIITLVDVPGFMPGKDQEYGGIIRHGAKLLYAYAEATVPKLTVIIRKAYGGAYVVMGSKHLRTDINFAWPTAEIAVMGSDAAVNIVYRDKIAASDDPATTRAELVKEYRDHFANPYVAAEHGYIDDVIDPAETRPKLIRALDAVQNKRDSLPPKKHGNIPL
jgi:acetyl-CoA carboxylase carboxyltransferase component